VLYNLNKQEGGELRGYASLPFVCGLEKSKEN